jgi:hypothetical protein
MLRKILIAIALLIAGLAAFVAVFVALQPSAIRVERTATMPLKFSHPANSQTGMRW